MPEKRSHHKRPEAVELVSYGGKFHFEDLKIRKLRNGNMVRVIIETPFTSGTMGELEKLFEKEFDVHFKEYIPEPVEDPDEKEQGKLDLSGEDKASQN
jgi:hypothetical protein